MQGWGSGLGGRREPIPGGSGFGILAHTSPQTASPPLHPPAMPVAPTSFQERESLVHSRRSFGMGGGFRGCVRQDAEPRAPRDGFTRVPENRPPSQNSA